MIHIKKDKSFSWKKHNKTSLMSEKNPVKLISTSKYIASSSNIKNVVVSNRTATFLYYLDFTSR